MKKFNIQFNKQQNRFISFVMAVALVAAIVYGYNSNSEKQQYQTFLQNSYQRAFRDLVKNVESVDMLLTKAEVTNSTVQSNDLMSQIWRQANSASENLAQLPVTHNTLTNTEKYLTQVGDFCYSVSKQNASNKLMTDDQVKQIISLQGLSQKLIGELHQMQQSAVLGKLFFNQTGSGGKLALQKKPSNAMNVSFDRVEKNFSEYPTLIYDGPFSDKVTQGKAKGLDGKDIDLNQAKEAAKKFVQSQDIGSIIEASSGKGTIQTFGLEIIPKDKDRNKSIHIDVTKKGGYVLWMMNPRTIPEKKLTDQQASDIAKKFLKTQGFGNLEETYFLKNDNSTVITFVEVAENGVLVYPDQMKVKVALDNGQITGFDATPYLMAHHKRDIKQAVISKEEARSKVNKRLQINREKLTIIPLPGDIERLCYEFRGKYRNSDYFVYINAENGNEENILKIIKEENGTLTQ